MISPIPISHFQRFELKYPLDLRIADKIIIGLLDYMRWDSYCQPKNNYNYFVSSLYFDSVTHGCYFQKEAGIRNRTKLRLRFYDKKISPDGYLFLEIKRKRDMVIVKDRLRMNKKDCFSLLRDGGIKEILTRYSPKERSVIEEFLWIKTYNSMQAKIMISYDRKALVSLTGLNFRVTFDFNIKASPATWIDKIAQKKIMKDLVIMEVKFNNVMPAWFHAIIQKYQLSKSSFSKYANSLDVCRGYSLLWI